MRTWGQNWKDRWREWYFDQKSSPELICGFWPPNSIIYAIRLRWWFVTPTIHKCDMNLLTGYYVVSAKHWIDYQSKMANPNEMHLRYYRPLKLFRITLGSIPELDEGDTRRPGYFRPDPSYIYILSGRKGIMYQYVFIIFVICGTHVMYVQEEKL